MTVSVSESLYVKCKARGNSLCKETGQHKETFLFLVSLISNGQFLEFFFSAGSTVKSFIRDLQESRALWKIFEGSHQPKRLCGRGSKMFFMCLEEG